MGMLQSGIRATGCNIGLGWTSMDSARDNNILGYQHCSMLQSGIYRMVPTQQCGTSATGCNVGPERAELNS